MEILQKSMHQSTSQPVNMVFGPAAANVYIKTSRGLLETLHDPVLTYVLDINIKAPGTEVNHDH